MTHIVSFMTNVQLYGWVLIFMGFFVREWLTPRLLRGSGILLSLLAFMFRMVGRIAIWFGIILLLVEWYNMR